MFSFFAKFFSVLGLSPYKPCRKSTGKKNPFAIANQPKLTVFFSILGLSLYKPGRESTGKKNPCNLLAKEPKLTTIMKGLMSTGLSLYKPVGNQLERKTAKYFGASHGTNCSVSLCLYL